MKCKLNIKCINIKSFKNIKTEEFALPAHFNIQKCHISCDSSSFKFVILVLNYI